MMNKIYGTSIRQDGLLQVGRKSFILFYGLYTDEHGNTYEYRHTFDHRPTWDEVKAALTEAINEHTEETILRGFVWKGMPVWLSDENQFNYKAAYDLAVQTDGASLPVKFKFGTDDTPVYHTFEDVEELTDFYTKAIAHVNTTLNEGWQEKDNINPDKFKTDE